MQMHLYSSYHIFTKHLLSPLREKIVFIDVGCGPLTSGIAFWAAAKQRDITYIGFEPPDKQSNASIERIAQLEQLVGRLTLALDIQKKPRLGWVEPV